MYNYDYEADVLLFLRLAKYLHSQNPAALEKILEMYADFDLAFLFELCESIIWEICTDAVFDPGWELPNSSPARNMGVPRLHISTAQALRIIRKRRLRISGSSVSPSAPQFQLLLSSAPSVLFQPFFSLCF